MGPWLGLGGSCTNYYTTPQQMQALNLFSDVKIGLKAYMREAIAYCNFLFDTKPTRICVRKRGRFFLRNYSEFPNASLFAICDIGEPIHIA